jgi:hypothetical protein
MKNDELIQVINKLGELLVFMSDRFRLGNDNIDITIEAAIRKITGMIEIVQKKLTANIENRVPETSNKIEPGTLKVFSLVSLENPNNYIVSDDLNKETLFSIERTGYDRNGNSVYFTYFGDREDGYFLYDTNDCEEKQTALHELVVKLTGRDLP